MLFLGMRYLAPKNVGSIPAFQLVIQIVFSYYFNFGVETATPAARTSVGPTQPSPATCQLV